MTDKTKAKLSKFTGPLIFISVFIVSLILLYLGSRPPQYELEVNVVSPYDIEAPRSVVNRNATEKRAREAQSLVVDIYTRSDNLSQEALRRVGTFAATVDDYYQALREDHKDQTQAQIIKPLALDQASEDLQRSLEEDLDYEFSLDDLKQVLHMSSSRYDTFRNRLELTANSLMAEAVDETELSFRIRDYLNKLSAREAHYKSDLTLIRGFLEQTLQGNVLYNEEATQNARQDAYERVLQNPILVNRGARIISSGELVTEDIYALLQELKLVEVDSLDYAALAGLSLMILVVLLILSLYMHIYEHETVGFNKRFLALTLACLIPLLVAVYLGQDYQVIPPVYFTAVILAAYFSYQTAIVFTMALIVITLPLVNFNPAFIAVAICGSLLAAHYARNHRVQEFFAKLLILLILVNLAASLGYSLMQDTGLANSSFLILSSVLSAVLSVIAAVGLLPVFELLFDDVSPASLVELSQPGQPLIRRLFLEAPGTSQHSMMVANLADAGAEAIGANALICRAGSYYHDIGKLRNPLYFTENQTDYNPHDQLSPEESTEIITRHTLDGLEMGKKYRLPKPILEIIVEHHGTTVLGYFYSKAKKAAEEQGLPPPDPADYRYKGPLPSSPESAVVMLADSTEAAIKSLKSRTMEDAEEMMQSVFRIKLEQNQLKNSGLKFSDIEKIQKAFMQVYSGHFHERVEYPKDEAQDDHYQAPAPAANHRL
ncbi:MAG: HDIG domain-containing protein [Eubacteriales bacterium]|nr:HDIG domain-containing protein [Clostridiales bacterium]MDY5836840.1 HDIG domain-containing protein [Eubacteriales bacterium]